jgi:MoaD family protein
VKVKIKFFTTLREITGKKEDMVDLIESTNVSDLLRFLSIKYGEQFAKYMYDEKTGVHNYLQILVNGNSITTLRELKTQLKDGDTLAIIPPVGGG